MAGKNIFAISILLFVSSLLFAETTNTMFYLRWKNTVPESTSITFTDYSNQNTAIATKALEITSETQNAFAAVYSTNRLGTHNIRFTSTQLSNGEDSIPFSITFFCRGTEFSRLVVGTTSEQYVSSTGSIVVRRANLAGATSYSSTILADLTLGKTGESIDDYPAGEYSANIQFIVEVQ